MATLSRILSVSGRALRRRCPNCGGHPIFLDWFRMAPRCPQCGLALERAEAGYLVGAYMFAVVAAIVFFAGLFAATLLATWPNPPWEAITVSSAAAMVILPACFYPYSKTLFLGFDLLFRPAGHHPAELSAPGEPGGQGGIEAPPDRRDA
jgi:uncharacterized protein (DUF983 family)